MLLLKVHKMGEKGYLKAQGVWEAMGGHESLAGDLVQGSHCTALSQEALLQPGCDLCIGAVGHLLQLCLMSLQRKHKVLWMQLRSSSEHLNGHGTHSEMDV